MRYQAWPMTAWLEFTKVRLAGGIPTKTDLPAWHCWKQNRPPIWGPVLSFRLHDLAVQDKACPAFFWPLWYWDFLTGATYTYLHAPKEKPVSRARNWPVNYLTHSEVIGLKPALMSALNALSPIGWAFFIFMCSQYSWYVGMISPSGSFELAPIHHQNF